MELVWESPQNDVSKHGIVTPFNDGISNSNFNIKCLNDKLLYILRVSRSLLTSLLEMYKYTEIVAITTDIRGYIL